MSVALRFGRAAACERNGYPSRVNNEPIETMKRDEDQALNLFFLEVTVSDAKARRELDDRPVIGVEEGLRELSALNSQ